MKKNKLIKCLTFLILLISTCYISKVKVIAKNYTSLKLYKETGDPKNLPNNASCDDIHNCIVLCEYGKGPDAVTDVSGYIGYYYKTQEWVIGASYLNSINGFNYIAQFKSLSVPKNDIYWENEKLDSKTGWLNTTGYNDLNEKFICPKYLRIDEQAFVELCFTNDEIKCSKSGNLGTDFLRANPLKEDTYISKLATFINKMDSKISNSPDFALLSDLDDELNYDPNLSDSANAKQNCEYLKKYDTTKYLKKFTDDLIENETKKYFNQKIESIASNDEFLESYRYENLLSLLILKIDNDNNITPRKIECANGASCYDKLINIIPNSFKTTINYIQQECGISNLNADEILENVKSSSQKIGLGIYNPTVDYDTELTCSDIFTPEITNFIKDAYFYLEIASIGILILMSALDYTQVILGNTDEISKVNQKLLKRIIIVAIILILPLLVNLILRIFKIEGFNSENPLCINIKEK